MSEPTDDELIAQALLIRDDIEAMKAAHAADLEPYEMGLQDIENELLGRMVNRESKSIGTEHGTAYQSQQLRVKVVDRPVWLMWLAENPLVIPTFITNHVSKEAVKAHLDLHKTNPPGIETSRFIQCNIRKA